MAEPYPGFREDIRRTRSTGNFIVHAGGISSGIGLATANLEILAGGVTAALVGGAAYGFAYMREVHAASSEKRRVRSQNKPTGQTPQQSSAPNPEAMPTPAGREIDCPAHDGLCFRSDVQTGNNDGAEQAVANAPTPDAPQQSPSK